MNTFEKTNDIDQSKKDEVITLHKYQLESIIENMSDASIIYNKEGRIILLNAEARKLYPKLTIQKTIEETYSYFEYFDLNDKIIFLENLPTMRAFKGERVKNQRIAIKLHNKIQITDISAIPIFDNEYNLVFVVVSYHDVSELIETQENLKAQQEKLLNTEKDKNKALEEAMKSKDEFFYLMTHEFKTPISVMNLALQAIDLMYKKEVTPKVNKYLNTIKQNVNRQLRLVNNLLDISRINSGHLKMNKSCFSIVHVIEAIVNSVQLYANQKNVVLKFNTNLQRKNIYSDEEKLERILLNLLSNALKFTPGGKSITVALYIKKYKNKDMISITVEDEGLGIPIDKQKTIFERFGQVDSNLSRQAEGTGLGLHLVKLLVDFLDGEILLNSTAGKGSIFTVLLPSSKYETYYEESVFKEISNPFFSDDNRIIQSAAIEFSDIYF